MRCLTVCKEGVLFLHRKVKCAESITHYVYVYVSVTAQIYISVSRTSCLLKYANCEQKIPPPRSTS